jgi:hypothetical protein
MNRVFLIVLAAVALAGCSKDPPDYHGVPTDDRPPSMLDTPDTAQPAPKQAAPQ